MSNRFAFYNGVHPSSPSIAHDMHAGPSTASVSKATQRGSAAQAQAPLPAGPEPPPPPSVPPPPLPPNVEPPPPPANAAKPRHLSAFKTTYDPSLDAAPVKRSPAPIHRVNGKGLPEGPVKDPREPWAVQGRRGSSKMLVDKVDVVDYKWDKNSTGPAPPPPPCAIVVTRINPLAPASELHRHFAQFGRIAEHRLELDPRTGASLGILRVRFVDDVSRHEDGTAHARATLGGRQDGHTAATEALRRTHGAKLGSAVMVGGNTGTVNVEMDADGSKCASLVKEEVERRYPPQAIKPPSTSTYARPARSQPGVIRHTPSPLLPGKSTAQSEASTSASALLPSASQPKLERASYVRKDDPNPPKLPPGPHLYNQGPNPSLRPQSHGHAADSSDWSRPPYALSPTAAPQSRGSYFRPRRGSSEDHNGKASSLPRQQPLMLKHQPKLKHRNPKEDDDMEMASSESPSDSGEDDKDEVFFPRSDAGQRQSALTVVPARGFRLRGPPSAQSSTPSHRTGSTQALSPRQVAMRKLAENGMPHLVVDQSRLAGATETITEPLLKAHFGDFRPTEIFSDGVRWYLTFTTYDTARRAQLVLERKRLLGADLQPRVEQAPSLEEAYAALPPSPFDAARPKELSASPGKALYSSRAALPPSPSRRGNYATDRELARDARNLIVHDLMQAFERDLRVRILESRVRQMAEKRSDGVVKREMSEKPVAASGTALTNEAGAVKLPSFARKPKAPRHLDRDGRSRTYTAEKVRQKEKRHARTSATPEQDSDISEAARSITSRKPTKAAGRSVAPDGMRFEPEELKPKIRRLSFTSSEDDGESVILPPKSVKPEDAVDGAKGDDPWLNAISEEPVKPRRERVTIDYSDDEEDGVPSLVQPTKVQAPAIKFDPREDLPPPDPFDRKCPVAEDQEDLHYVRLALERLQVGEPLHPYPEDAPHVQPEPAHATGSARTEGYYKIAPAAKSAYLPLRNRAQVDVSNISATAVSRAARASTRRYVAGMERQAQASTSDADVVKFNQLRSRKKQLKFARSPIHDWGLYAMEFIPPGEMICEYVGELVRQQVADKRERMYDRQGIGSSYLFRVDDEYVVDATKKGSISRLINHSCTPNSTARIITIGGQKKIVIYAGQPLEPGDEVLYDYKFSSTEGEERIPCLCGSAGCRKYLN